MALDKSKSGFGFDMEERLKKVTSTSTSASAPAAPTKENKTKRLYATVKPSTFQKLDAYATRQGDSVNNLVNTILEDFIAANEL